MSDSINKIELKKQSRNFRVISSRTLTSDFQMFDDNLKRLIYFLDNNLIIKKYIDSCISKDDNFNIEVDVKNVSSSYGKHIFANHIEEAKEVSYNYQILKYISDNNVNCRTYIYPYSYSKQYQDKLKGFCDNVVQPLIDYINGNFERIFTEMGLDEETNYNVINNYGGQVNIAKDSSTLIASQNNYNEIDELVNNVKNNINSIDNSEIKQEIIDNIEGIQEEVKKNDIKKGRIKSFISSLQGLLPKIGTAIEVTASITELVTFAQNFIK